MAKGNKLEKMSYIDEKVKTYSNDIGEIRSS